MRKYKEKKFTKEQLRRIHLIHEHIKWLRKSGVDVISSTNHLHFVVSKNLKFIYDNETPAKTCGDGMTFDYIISDEIIKIDEICESTIYYPPKWEIEK